MNDIHPTATGGDGRIAPRRTTYKPGDDVLDILHCVNCGLPFRVGKDTEGDSTESPGISYATNSAVGTNFLRNGNFQTWSLGTSFTDRSDNFTTADGWDIYENGITAFNSIAKDSTVTLNGLPTLRLEPNMNLINVFTVSATPTTMVTGGTYLVPTNTLTVTLNMPAAAANVYFIVRDIGNNALANNITLHRHGSESIDGTAADKTLSTRSGQWLVFSDGTNWYTLLNGGITVRASTVSLSAPSGGEVEMRVNGIQVLDATENSLSLKGTNTNDNASAGYMGEYIESVVSNVNFPTSTQFGDLTSITLTAGDWDVNALCDFNLASATGVSAVFIGISQTTGNANTGLALGTNESSINPPSSAANNVMSAITAYRISLSGSATIYFKFRAIWATSAPTASGRLSARRVR